MSTPYSRLLLLPILCTLVACGPGRIVKEYEYLTKESERTESAPPRERPPSRPERPSESPDSRSAVDVIVETALSYRGTPYQYGGMSRRGMDCSGLVQVSYQAANRSVPRTSSEIAAQGTKVSRSRIQPGHLLLFSAKGGSRINHVGLVVSVSGNQVSFIHATTSRGVRVDQLSDPYWEPLFRKAVRF